MLKIYIYSIYLFSVITLRFSIKISRDIRQSQRSSQSIILFQEKHPVTGVTSTYLSVGKPRQNKNFNADQFKR